MEIDTALEPVALSAGVAGSYRRDKRGVQINVEPEADVTGPHEYNAACLPCCNAIYSDDTRHSYCGLQSSQVLAISCDFVVTLTFSLHL